MRKQRSTVKPQKNVVPSPLMGVVSFGEVLIDLSANPPNHWCLLIQLTHHNLFHSPLASQRKNFDLLLIGVPISPGTGNILSDDITKNQVFVISQYNLMQ